MFDSSAYSESDPLQEIEDFEALPMSDAFHALMMTNYTSRSFRYRQDKPFACRSLSLPHALALAASTTSIVENMFFTGEKTRVGFTGTGNFTINGYEYSCTFDENVSTLSPSMAMGEQPKSTLPTESFAAFLVNILTRHPHSPEDSASSLMLSSVSTANLIRHTLSRLAMYTGVYTSSTKATFDHPPSFSIIANLIEGETPTTNAAMLDIDLSYLAEKHPPEDAAEFDAHQEATISGPDISKGITSQQARIVPSNAIPPADFLLRKELRIDNSPPGTIITPDNNFEQWYEVCKTFGNHIKPLLIPYLGLDHSWMELDQTNFDIL